MPNQGELLSQRLAAHLSSLPVLIRKASSNLRSGSWLHNARMASKVQRGRPRKRVSLAVDTSANAVGTRNTDLDAEPRVSNADTSRVHDPTHTKQQQQLHRFVAVDSDVELLEDFCAYLENRVLTKNIGLLRRMFVEFLTRQEHTLVQFKCFGANLVAVLPFAVPNDAAGTLKRKHAELLLQKAKPAMVDRACVFDFLFARVATKNMNLLKQMFLEFCRHSEETITEFVKLGVAAISVIPYEPAHYHFGGFLHCPFSAIPVGNQDQQHPVHEEAKTVDVCAKEIATQRRKSHPANDLGERRPVGSSSPLTSREDAKTLDGSTSSESSSVTTTSLHKRIIRKPVRFCSEPGVDAAAAKRRRSARVYTLAMKETVDPRRKDTDAPMHVFEEEEEEESDSNGSASRSKEIKHEAHATTQDKKARGTRPGSGRFRIDAATRRLKVDVLSQMQGYEAQQPWEKVFHELPLPFDEARSPELAEKLKLFWKVHGRAVWERNFWAPLTEDTHREANHQRKSRQRVAQTAFTTIICDAYAVFGAAFFVQLDATRHPGWWYRGPMLDIFAYHLLVGPSRCWQFVETQLYARFPTCGMELPLKSPNYAVVRSSYRKRESCAMWVTKAFGPQIIKDMQVFKDGVFLQTRKAAAASTQGDEGERETSKTGSGDRDENADDGEIQVKRLESDVECDMMVEANTEEGKEEQEVLSTMVVATDELVDADTLDHVANDAAQPDAGAVFAMQEVEAARRSSHVSCLHQLVNGGGT